MNKIYLLENGDCFKLMLNIPDASVDMILCDLPYGETGNNWDKKPFELIRLFEQYRRVIKDNGCIALNGTFKFGVQLYEAAPDLYKYDWVWEKENGTNAPMVNHQPFRTHEFVFIFGKGGVTPNARVQMKYFPQKTEGKPYCQKSGHISTNWKGTFRNTITDNKDGKRMPKTVLRFPRDRGGYHPTLKPVALLEYLIQTYTNKGDLVLDNCMGSGSTGVACVNTDRDFIGIELNEKYFATATRRIEEARERKESNTQIQFKKG